MAEYERVGQTTPLIEFDDGTPAYPERVVLACTTCGALIAATLQRAHDLSHSSAVTATVSTQNIQPGGQA